jgi:hypothetical protein
MDKPEKLILAREVGGEGNRLRAEARDLLHEAFRLRARGVVMDADAPAMLREVERNSAAEPERSSGHKRGCVVLHLGHEASMWG